MRRRLLAGGMALTITGAVWVPAQAMAAPSKTLPPADLSATTKVPGSTKVSFWVGLDRPEKKARKALRNVSDPTSGTYRNVLSRSKVASKYGATPATIKSARATVGKYGLKLHPDDTGVFARVSGTAKQMSKWIGGPLGQAVLPLPGGEVTVIGTKVKRLKGSNPGIREFYGVDIKSKFSSGPAQLSTVNPPYDGVQSGTPENSCLPEVSAELNAFTYSVNELRTAYGLDKLPGGSKTGKKTRVAIVAQGDGFSDEALKVHRECFDLPAVKFQRVDVRGLSGDLPEGGEGDLDVQIVQSVLPPGSKVNVVQTSAYDTRDFLTWSTVFGLDKRPDAATTSYGLCEPLALESRGKQGLRLTDSVFVRLGLAGTSVFSAAGDRGSSDCVNNETGKGPKGLAVDYPGTSEFVTSVGGTRIELTPDNHRANEVTWFGPALRSPVTPPENTGGGGGYSQLFDRPWWQKKSVVRSQARTVPDVSAHASPVPGWPVVTADEAGNLMLQPIGGTSAATPFTAATIGVIAAHERVKGRPSFGLIQPMLYHLSDKKPSTFYDVQTGNNDVFNKGCCSAERGYDAASGIGSIRFDLLAKRIPKKG